ncbi:MAG: SGNH/GDSL hydrolase family protein [Zavarzinella sp.]
MKVFSLSVLALIGALSNLAPVGGNEPLELKKGDRIVFLGDSITQAGNRKDGYVDIIRTEMKEKRADLGIEVIGAGISGNKVPDLQKRLERDVLSKKPTIVFIYIGINDVWHGEKDPARGTSKENFEAGLKEIIAKVQQGGAKVILCTPSVIGEKTDGTNNLDSKLDEYSAISRKVATETKSSMCDLRQAFLDHLKTNNKGNKERGVLTSDRVHLNGEGNKFVAATMLKMLK